MYSSAFDMMPPPGTSQSQEEHHEQRYYDEEDDDFYDQDEDVRDVGTSRTRKVITTTRELSGDDSGADSGEHHRNKSSILNDNIYVPRSNVKSSRTTYSTNHHYGHPSTSRTSSYSVGHRPETVVYRESRSGRGGDRRHHTNHYRSADNYNDVHQDFDTFHDSKEPHFYGTDMKHPPGGKKFLKKVQHELEEQRGAWAEEIGKMTTSATINPKKGHGRPQGSNSYVDTRSGVPIFKAFVDVSEFKPEDISVNVDSVQNKIIVRAEKGDGRGRSSTMTKTFTQKVQMPRYADESNVRSFMSKTGILKLEVPLMFYFPMHAMQKDGKPAKSFVNEVKTRPDGQQYLEILVNTGSDYRARDLHVRVVDDDKLVISAERHTTSGRTMRKVIKQYTLPKMADIDEITSKLGKDGRLSVKVPLRRNSRDGTPTTLSPPLSPTR